MEQAAYKKNGPRFQYVEYHFMRGWTISYFDGKQAPPSQSNSILLERIPFVLGKKNKHGYGDKHQNE